VRVCVCEKERETDRQTDRQTDRESAREQENERERDREGESNAIVPDGWVCVLVSVYSSVRERGRASRETVKKNSRKKAEWLLFIRLLTEK
jgi:hypothetical protein